MLRIRFLASVFALFFGVMVVGVSILSTNQVISFEGVQVSDREFYLGSEILPDHIAYPLVAAADRVILLAADDQEKIRLQMTYANIRMDYARSLLVKDQPLMASQALTKSQKYMALSANQVLHDENINSRLAKEVLTNLQQNLFDSKKMIEQLPIQHRCLAESLVVQNQVLVEQLAR